MVKNFLFEFFDGEQFSYQDYEDIREHVNDTLEETKFKFEKDIFPISHYRYDYFTFFYKDESDNPKVWLYKQYVQENEKNPKLMETQFTDTIIMFFQRILVNKTAGFHWVTAEEEKNNKNIVEDRYIKWFSSLFKMKKWIENSKSDNVLVKKLHYSFSEYYLRNENQIVAELQKKRILTTSGILIQKEVVKKTNNQEEGKEAEIKKSSKNIEQQERNLIEKLLKFFKV
ncbi:hypothetical protein C8C82_2759 [Flavobacterium sp. 81]|uniref:hypothetical protein n=1 Tax=Flavobacterium sp. 81 TaxID=2135621 RepID=UPI000EB193B3|nr:hypothetical protein [Flavobacterium sp. 81]RKR10766.1 hypothetical protein C8C82_2759 [Flavobacterium sp. 81]